MDPDPEGGYAEPGLGMTPSRIDLQELARRENEQTEWKENVADIDDVVATLSAFANDLQNMGGGYVVCGAKEVKDEHAFPRLLRAGLTASRLKEVENTVLARCRDRVDPPIAPLVEELESDAPDKRLLVFVQPATGAAHTFRRGNEGGRHFVRVSRATIEARNGLLKDLLVRKGALEPWDRRPCANATEADIDLLVLRDVLQRLNLPDATTPERYLSAEVSLSAFVPPLFAREPLTSALRPRLFAILLFGRDPQRFIPGAVSFFSTYDGPDRSSPRGQRVEMARTLMDQLRQMLLLVEGEARTLYDKEDTAQPSAQKYPPRALREAVVNAFAHRDYELVDPLRVTAFPDRVEVSSPGGLPLGVTLEDLQSAATGPRWRNQTLAWFLSRLGYAEAEGQGIQTIQSSMKNAGCPPPEFRADMVRTSCVLRAHPRATAKPRD